jgi:plastocyanin
MLSTDQPLRSDSAYGWQTLVAASAVIDVVLVSLIAAVQREREGAAIAVFLAVGLGAWWLGRRRAGGIVLALVFADVAFFMVPAAVSGVAHSDPVRGTAVTVVLSAASLVGLIALAARLAGVGAAAARVLASGAVVVVVLVLVIGGTSIFGTGHGTTASGTVVQLSARDTSFSTRELVAPAGRVTVRFTNHDLFWHTFTIRGSGVDLRVPVGGTRQATFQVQQGTYRFACRIPGHEGAGMKGVLIVR